MAAARSLPKTDGYSSITCIPPWSALTLCGSDHHQRQEHLSSSDDLHITLPMVGQWTLAKNKPFSLDEFGFQQGMGDQQRASAFATIYNTAKNYENNVTSIFWNLGPQLASTSYEVNPQTPFTWQVVQSHAPPPSTT